MYQVHKLKHHSYNKHGFAQSLRAQKDNFNTQEQPARPTDNREYITRMDNLLYSKCTFNT